MGSDAVSGTVLAANKLTLGDKKNHFLNQLVNVAGSDSPFSRILTHQYQESRRSDHLINSATASAQRQKSDHSAGKRLPDSAHARSDNGRKPEAAATQQGGSSSQAANESAARDSQVNHHSTSSSQNTREQETLQNHQTNQKQLENEQISRRQNQLDRLSKQQQSGENADGELARTQLEEKRREEWSLSQTGDGGTDNPDLDGSVTVPALDAAENGSTGEAVLLERVMDQHWLAISALISDKLEASTALRAEMQALLEQLKSALQSEQPISKLSSLQDQLAQWLQSLKSDLKTFEQGEESPLNVLIQQVQTTFDELTRISGSTDQKGESIELPLQGVAMVTGLLDEVSSGQFVPISEAKTATDSVAKLSMMDSRMASFLDQARGGDQGEAPDSENGENDILDALEGLDGLDEQAEAVTKTERNAKGPVNSELLAQSPVHERLASLAKQIEKNMGLSKVEAKEKSADTLESNKISGFQRSLDPLQSQRASVKGPVFNLMQPMQSREWATELGQKMLMLVSSKLQSAELQLTPKDLGPIDVKIKMQHEQASVVFTSQVAQTRDALEQALPRLREMLEQHGVNLGQADVNEQPMQQFSDKESFGSQPDTGSSSDESMEDDMLDISSVQMSVGLVDYYA